MTTAWPAFVRNGAGAALALCFCLVMLFTAAVAAQGQAQEGFETMTPDMMAQEALPAAPFVFIAYAVAWVALLGYVFVLWRKLSRLERELRDVRAQLGPE
jgi:CcmD family protein